MRTIQKIYLFCTGVLLIASCTKESHTIEKAKDHSRWIIHHIYRDTVFTYLRGKHLPPNDVRRLIEDFRSRYKPGTLRGGFRSDLYHINLSGNNESLLFYEYKSDSQLVKMRFSYELLRDTFEIKSLIIHHSTLQQSDSTLQKIEQ